MTSLSGNEAEDRNRVREVDGATLIKRWPELSQALDSVDRFVKGVDKVHGLLAHQGVLLYSGGQVIPARRVGFEERGAYTLAGGAPGSGLHEFP
jgi:hypothetical protein